MLPLFACALLFLVMSGQSEVFGDGHFYAEGEEELGSGNDEVEIAGSSVSTEETTQLLPDAVSTYSPFYRQSGHSTPTAQQVLHETARSFPRLQDAFEKSYRIGEHNRSASEAASTATRCAERVARVRIQAPCLLLHVNVALWISTSAAAPITANPQHINCSSGSCTRSPRPESRWTPVCMRGASTRVQCLSSQIESDERSFSDGRYARLSMIAAGGEQLALFFDVRVSVNSFCFTMAMHRLQ